MSGSSNPFVAGATTMTYGGMVDQFAAILNRDDCTTALQNTFMQQGIMRIEREARLPCMERSITIAPQTFMSAIDIPVDLIAPIDILVQSASGRTYETPQIEGGVVPGIGVTMVPLQKLSYRELLAVPASDVPRAYARSQSQFILRGWAPPGAMVQLLYFGAFTPLASASSSNELTAVAPDLAIYAALSLAGDYFQIDTAVSWEQRYQQILSQVMGVASDVEWSGGPAVMTPAYGSFDTSWSY